MTQLCLTFLVVLSTKDPIPKISSTCFSNSTGLFLPPLYFSAPSNPLAGAFVNIFSISFYPSPPSSSSYATAFTFLYIDAALLSLNKGLSYALKSSFFLFIKWNIKINIKKFLMNKYIRSKSGIKSCSLIIKSLII